MSIGVGYLFDDVDGEASGNWSLRGSALPLDILIGGTLAPGLVLGGGLWVTPGLKFHNEIHGETTDLEDDYDLAFTHFGPFVDYYFDPKQGFHAMAAVGFAKLTLDDRSGLSSSTDASGYALTLGIGQDFWIGKQWSVGVLGRLTYAILNESPDNETADHRVIAPALLASFTYH
jgi:hypothetical protein